MTTFEKIDAKNYINDHVKSRQAFRKIGLNPVLYLGR